MRRQRGFTLMELVAVMLIVAILAVSASGMFNRRSFDTAGFTDEVRAQLAYAQKTAVASRRTVNVSIASNSISFTICQSTPCAATTPLQTLRQQSSLTPRSGSNVSVTAIPASFAFNANGTASANASISIIGDTTRTVTITSGTGYVH